jgi:hypothetical protein
VITVHLSDEDARLLGVEDTGDPADNGRRLVAAARARAGVSRGLHAAAEWHATRLAAENQRLRVLVDDLADPDPCWHDHHGYCQAHGWFATDPVCPHKRAREITGGAA